MPRTDWRVVYCRFCCVRFGVQVLSYAKWQAQPLGITTERKCVDNYGISKSFKRERLSTIWIC